MRLPTRMAATPLQFRSPSKASLLHRIDTTHIHNIVQNTSVVIFHMDTRRNRFQGPCAYVKSLLVAIRFAKECNAHLFTQKDLEVFESYEKLSINAMRILSRLLTRRSNWIKSQSIVSYITDTDDALQSLPIYIEDLQNYRLIEVLNENLPFELAWDAMTSILRADELQALYKTICGAKYSGKTGKEEILSTLKGNIESQRTYFGKSLKESFPSTLHKYLKNKESEAASYFRLVPAVSLLLRRAQRLYQMTSSLPTGSTVCSAYEPLEFYAPLMSTFRVVTYAPYRTDAEDGNQYPIFENKRAFNKWETCMEIRSYLEKGDSTTVDVLSVLQDTISVYDSPLFSSVFFTPDLPLTTILTQHILPSTSLARDNEVLSFALLTAASVLLMSLSISDNYLAHLHSLLHSCSAGFRGEITSSSSERNRVESRDREDYLIKYQASAGLVYLVSELGSALEKKSCKDYATAILLSELLLSLPYLEHRRGRWYIRLCVNLEHLKLTDYVRRAAERGLSDGRVMMSDEIDLGDRLSKSLAKSISKSLPKPLSKPSLSSVDTSEQLELMTCLDMLERLEGGEHMEERRVLLIATLLKRMGERGYIRGMEAAHKNVPILRLSEREILRAEDRPGGWSCSFCTFFNTGGRSCEMCDGERGIELKVAEKVEKKVERKGERKAEVIDLVDSSDDEHVAKEIVEIEKSEESGEEQRSCMNYNLVLKHFSSLSLLSPIATDSERKDSKSVNKEGLNILKKCKEVMDSLPSPPSSSSDLVDLSLNCFVVQGKRFGDAERRRSGGKSRFVGGGGGELLSVEQLVLALCKEVDPEACGELEGEGVAGEEVTSLHNKKGKKKQSKKAKEREEVEEEACGIGKREDEKAYSFTTISYPEAINGGGWRGWHCEGGILRSLFGLLMWGVFFSPQGGVFLTPYQDAPLDFPYPSFYQRREESIMKRLQQIASFSPHELLGEIEEVYRRHFGERCTLFAWESYPLKGLQVAGLCLGARNLALLCFAYSFQFRQFRSGAPDLFLVRVKRKGEVVNLERVLGEEWQCPPTSRLPPSRRQAGESWMLRSPQKKRIKAAGERKDAEEEAESQFRLIPPPLSPSSSLLKSPLRSPLHSPYRSPVSSPQKPRLPLSLSPPLSPIQHRLHSQNSIATEEQGLDLGLMGRIEELEWESLLVEVKGPSDHLAYKQVLWLQLGGLMTAQCRPLVCQVKE